MGGFTSALAMSALKTGMQSDQEQSSLKNQSDQIREAQKADQRERQQRLKRALATQRARFGAQGVSAGQSSAALMQGYVAETKRDAKEAQRQTTLRLDQLQDQAEWSRRNSLLKLASPMAQATSSFLTNRISRLSVFDD